MYIFSHTHTYTYVLWLLRPCPRSPCPAVFFPPSAVRSRKHDRRQFSPPLITPCSFSSFTSSGMLYLTVRLPLTSITGKCTSACWLIVLIPLSPTTRAGVVRGRIFLSSCLSLTVVLEQHESTKYLPPAMPESACMQYSISLCLTAVPSGALPAICWMTSEAYPQTLPHAHFADCEPLCSPPHELSTGAHTAGSNFARAPKCIVE